jgi:hypothetical protein
LSAIAAVAGHQIYAGSHRLLSQAGGITGAVGEANIPVYFMAPEDILRILKNGSS